MLFSFIHERSFDNLSFMPIPFLYRINLEMEVVHVIKATLREIVLKSNVSENRLINFTMRVQPD